MIKFLTDKVGLFDIDYVDGECSNHIEQERNIGIRVEGNLKQENIGDAYVNGIKITKPIFFIYDNRRILSLSVGEVIKEYDKTYEVKLVNFMDEDGSIIKDIVFNIKSEAKRKKDVRYKDHDDVALLAGQESLVLLKNENDLLPLKEDAVLNIFGNINSFRISNFGAPAINPRWCPTFIDAVKDHSNFRLNEELINLYLNDGLAIPSKEVLDNASKLSDTAIIFLTRRSGEDIDNRAIKGEYYLKDEELKMIEEVTKVFSKTILILNSGYPIEMGFIDKFNISSVIYTGYAGMLATYALIETLDGRNVPSGKLPTTFPYDYFDTPASKNFITPKEGESNPFEKEGAIKTYYLEDMYVGYRYFDSFNYKPAYYFGHGLSYTNFSIEYKTFINNQLSVLVTNTGKYAGKEVVQVYVKVNSEKYETVNRSLCAFKKTKLLAPNESELLHIDIDVFALANYIDGNYVLIKGQYELFVGDNLIDSKVFVSFDVDEDKIIKKCNRVALPVEEFKVLSKDNPSIESLSKKIEYEDRLHPHAVRKEFKPQELPKYNGELIKWNDVKNNIDLLENFISQMNEEELCRLNCNAGNNWNYGQDGTAGKLPVMEKYGIKALEVSDANAGVNIVKPNIGFPQSSSIAATFNTDIACLVGKVIALESIENHVVINLGPGFNIQRNILNGRNSEYFSEDPYLSGTMAGWQGKGLEDNGVGSTYKHMFANNAETLRKSQESIVSERALREIYLKNFEYAFRVHKPIGVMNCYNALNGIYPAESVELMQSYVRDELGFDGIIMTDWYSYVTISEIEICKAGTNWISDGGEEYVQKLYTAYKQGLISKAVLQHNALHVVKAFIKYDR